MIVQKDIVNEEEYIYILVLSLTEIREPKEKTHTNKENDEKKMWVAMSIDDLKC